MKTAAVFVALVCALALQTTIAGLLTGGHVAVNLVLVVVVYVALAFGPVTGLLAGAAGGLAQDALAGGIVGIGGLSKTLVGFLVGVLGAQFIVSQTLPRFAMFVAATVVHELVFQAIFALVESHAFAPQYSAVLVQALVNGVVGVAAFVIVEHGPEMLARRRMRRASFSKRRF
ncbi:MAG TPA: rod shape-determining protein MreD [Vicinamibacterales bacterium]|nr:rod shape-determining protein MreD [Vicinamibacterales bacterium]